jgi:beta-glucoside PTS system EIICBA component
MASRSPRTYRSGDWGLHVGVDTVNLGGEGFRPAVQQGQDVEAGDLLVEVGLDLVAKAGYDTTTMLVVTNTAQLAAVTPVEGGSLEHGSRALRVRV